MSTRTTVEIETRVTDCTLCGGVRWVWHPLRHPGDRETRPACFGSGRVTIKHQHEEASDER